MNRVFITTIFGLALASPAQAALTNGTSPAGGTVIGKEWLELAFTAGTSPDQAVATPGARAWMGARASEVTTLRDEIFVDHPPDYRLFWRTAVAATGSVEFPSHGRLANLWRETLVVQPSFAGPQIPSSYVGGWHDDGVADWNQEGFLPLSSHPPYPQAQVVLEDARGNAQPAPLAFGVFLVRSDAPRARGFHRHSLNADGRHRAGPRLVPSQAITMKASRGGRK